MKKLIFLQSTIDGLKATNEPFQMMTNITNQLSNFNTKDLDTTYPKHFWARVVNTYYYAIN